jgi:hypothetical protein
MANNPVVTIYDDSGNTTPTMRMSAGGASLGQTLQQFTGNPSIASGATVNLFTVPAGKTFYVTDIYVGANTATQFSVQIQANGTAIFNGFCKGDTGPIDMPGIETQPQAAAGTAVTLVLGTAAATTAAYFVSGFVH